jgi:hypothetical protein
MRNPIMKVYEVPGLDSLGAYDPFTGTIVLDQRLNKYPDLKKAVLEHEIGHSKDKNVLQALLRDIRDYPYLNARKDCIAYQKETQKHVILKLAITISYSFGLILFVLPVTTVVTYSFRIRRWFGEKFK